MTKMLTNNSSFVAWEEHIICHDKGSRVVHFYLKNVSGQMVLAVVGTERSIRHMMYVLSDEFLQAYGAEGFYNGCTKWRARREVVDWLTSVVKDSNVEIKDSTKSSGSLYQPVAGSSVRQTSFSYLMMQRKLKVQNSGIEWSGKAWTCAKQLKHYPAFCRTGTSIAVHSFVFIMAEEESNYIGYIEDMYEDKKGQKKIKVRWFHHNEEVKGVMPELYVHPREVFITPYVQVISAECVDGPAIILTPNHYERCLGAASEVSSSGIRLCSRQFKNNKIKPFSLTKLRGYSNQAILSCLDGPVSGRQKFKSHIASAIAHQGIDIGGARNARPMSWITKGEQASTKLKLRFSTKTRGINFQAPVPRCSINFRVDDKIELLCQDSGIRGCWFRCKVLQASGKQLKVQYDDVEDADESGNLEEWVPASRVAAPDKLGMRCSGRLTVRPRPPSDSIDCTFDIGAPVDVWWSDGWWEGVVIGCDTSGNGSVHVYFPGEERFLNFDKENVRTSRDWVGDRWVCVEARPDILHYISANINPSIKLPGCSSGYTVPEHEFVTSKLEAVKEDEEEGPVGSAGMDIIKQTWNNEAAKINKCGGDDEARAGNEDKSAMTEDLESATQRCEAIEVP